MNNLSFDDPNRLADWLEDYNYFVLARAANFSQAPQREGNELPQADEVSFQLALVSSGSSDAGQTLHLMRFLFIARQVSIFTAKDDKKPIYDFTRVMEGLTVDDESSLIDLEIDENIRLQCRSIDIESLPEISLVNQPFISNRFATIYFPNQPIPIPAAWIEWLAGVGISANWHRLGSEPIVTQSMPQQEYEGWFLKSTESSQSNERGIMLRTLRAHENGFLAEFDDWDQFGSQSSSKTWQALSLVAVSLPNTLVRCGNCLLTANEWQQALHDGSDFLHSLNFEERCGKGIPDNWFPITGSDEEPTPPRLVNADGSTANYGLWPYYRRL
ncbi:MAG: hypothetical protein HY986_19780 [Candidatus Melainabacteria bacterium]|nr:hypothetical protein [Candidatus Melainabacteria bacterium]